MPAYLNIVFPVHNEEQRLRAGIEGTIAFLDDHGIEDYVLTIVDNDSTDETCHIAAELSGEYSQVRYLPIPQKGVGIAFRTAVQENSSPIIGYMDIDLATDLRHILEVLSLFQNDENLMFVNGSRWANGYGSTGRGLKRRITSMGLTAVLKLALGMKASDAICGFKFFRKKAAEELIELVGAEEDGWFYIIEMLLCAESTGMNMCELPVSWHDDGHSSVDTVAVTRSYLSQIKEYRKKMNDQARK